ncbi:ComEC/Rec2 family competence protein [Flavobacterium sp.]|uniref:ComEC/Rec2 family competence protein n=1 Tax=Flavobacterium sp. TaxID=239 RepID=UPI003D6BAE53
MKYTINFLPARYGDCIWIEYGEDNSLNHILIDGGTGGTKAHIKELLEALPSGERIIELLVVTHIDRDHIEGILSLLEENDLPCVIKSVWFNGWPHLLENKSVEFFGAVQGERLTAAILKHKLPWNTHFEGNAVVVPEEGELPRLILDGGMEIILLSPMFENLAKLRDAWEDEVKKAGLDPGYGAQVHNVVDGDVQSFGVPEIPDVENLAQEEFKEDSAPANGSSIAFIAKYNGTAVLLTGDSHPGVISRSLNRLGEQIPFKLVKLSHHGSKGNTSPELMEQFDCNRFVISTNGSIYHHPDAVNMARLLTIKKNPEIIFNYTSEHNKIWKLPILQEKYGYTTIYPDDMGIVISL